MAVGKSGRSSGFTIGTVEEVGVAGWIMYDAGTSWAFFSGQIAISGNPLFCQRGDSGAVIWSNDLQRHPVGLLFAGGGTGVRNLANNIHNVELALEIALMT
jgi:hypothetical protein